MTDTELMFEVRDGRVERLGELFERHHARLYHFCLRMVGQPQGAEDLVQEVFIRMLRYRTRFRDGGDFTAWMFTLARNACIDHLRRAGRAGPAVPDSAEPVSEAPSSSEQILHDESVGLLHRALMRLPAERREVLLLSRFESKKYDEIAAVLGCSVGAVKVRVHRAIRQLRDIYRELQGEATP